MKKVAILSLAALILVIGFQNCSEDVAFSKISAKDIICNPLDGGSCSLGDGEGLLGNLYYLTQADAHLFSGDLGNTVLNDYLEYGTRVPKYILMTRVNVTPRSWTEGFQQADGTFVQDENGNDLLEWFMLDLGGFIQLAEGTYQFATLSDDGMYVAIDDQQIIKHDGIHSPSWKCATTMVTFAKNDKKKIHVQYFQGPRDEIAMQLLVRPASDSGDSCDENGGWSTIPSSAYATGLGPMFAN